MANYSKKYGTDECLMVSTATLRTAGAFEIGAVRNGELRYSGPDGSPLLIVGFAVDLCAGESGSIEVRHPNAEPYQIGLVRDPWHGHWKFISRDGSHSYRLYLPPGCSRFATRAEHDLIHPSDRPNNAHRPGYRLQLLKQRYAAALPGSVKARRLELQVMEAEQRVLLQAAARLKPRR